MSCLLVHLPEWCLHKRVIPCLAILDLLAVSAFNLYKLNALRNGDVGYKLGLLSYPTSFILTTRPAG
jgi:hypothetical protein